MKLLTHNMLACNIKGVENGYPFKIEAAEVVERAAEYDPDFLRHIYPKLEWPAFLEAARTVRVCVCARGRMMMIDLGAVVRPRRLCVVYRCCFAHESRRHPLSPSKPPNNPPPKPTKQLKCAEGLPDAVDDAALRDEAFLRAFHHALLEVHLEEGALVCPETGRRFKVSKGIPNLLLNEDEV